MRMYFFAASVSALLFTLSACGPAGGEAPAPPLPSVIAARPAMTTIGDSLELTGAIAPSASVDLVARIAGFVRAKEFRDGSYVRKGQILFRLEADSLAAQLQLNAAQETRARQEYARQQRLLKQDSTSRTEVEAAASELKQASANSKLAKINLGHALVRAPFSGWIGEGGVDVGAYVGGSGTPVTLATVQRIDPVYVEFTLGEREVLRVLSAGGGRAGADGRVVEVGLQGDAGYPYRGVLSFANKGVDAATGSLQARAIVRNGPGQPLLPGLFARVRIQSQAPQPRLTVPARAVQSDALGDYVYVVDREKRVRRRDVSLGGEFGTSRAITDGLGPADLVVIEGLAKVRIGEQARVRIRQLPPVNAE